MKIFLFWNMTSPNPRYLSVDMTFQNLYIFYQNFVRGGGVVIFTIKTKQGFQIVKLKSWLRPFCCCHHDLINRYEISVSFVVDTTPSFSPYDICHFKIINVDSKFSAHDCVSGLTFFSFFPNYLEMSLYSDSMARSYISILG
jgi:hypothetical protein